MKFTDMPPDTFETARLLLRPVTIMDVDAIFGSYAQDEEVVRYLIWRPHRSRSETQAYVERCMATPSEVERTYMLVGRGDNVVRGALALRQRAPHRLDCGYVLARPWWRQRLDDRSSDRGHGLGVGPAFSVPHRRGVRFREHRFGPRAGEIRFHTRGPAASMAAAPEHQQRAARLL